MHYTLERIVNGDATILTSFANAKRLWTELFDAQPNGTSDDWAKWLSNKQMAFESQCGSRFPGQEVMAWSGFAVLYSTQDGFDQNEAKAKKLADAFAKSMCSLEVKMHAEEAAKSYLG